MAIDTKSIQVCLWKILCFSMQICYNFVSEKPVFSSVSLFFILLYMFSPTFFTFIIYSLLILISAAVFYRVFFNGDNANTEFVKSYKKNDENPSNMGTNGSISDNVKDKNREKYMQRSNIEDKNMVCSTRSRYAIVDKRPDVEENVRDIEEVNVDSVTDGAECSSCKANEHGISQLNAGCDEGSKIYSRRKIESSGNSEDMQEDTHEDEQNNVMDPGDSDIERSKRLESMIARRKARKLFSFQVRHTLMSAGNNDPVEHLASILVPRINHHISNNSNDLTSPGSAPSVLLPIHNPFDIPYETHEERPNLTDESFQQEFLAENKDVILCRHASFSWGALFQIDTTGDEDELFSNDISFKLRAPQKLKNQVPTLEIHLENKNVGEGSKKESCQGEEAISNSCSAEDHATQEGQAAQRAPDSFDIRHKEDKSDTQKKEMIGKNINVGSSSSSSSEENLPVCKPNKDAILRSLTSFRRNIVLPKDDDYKVNGFTYDSDQAILNSIKTDDGFLYAARVMNDHARSDSLASDMLVEVSEISSPRSLPSLDEEYSGNDEVKEISSHPSQVDTRHESISREVPEPEISDQHDTFGGVSRVNHNAEAITSDVLPEKVFEENSITSCNLLSSSRTGLPDSTQIHLMDSSIEDLPDSTEKNNIGNITIYNLSDSEIPTNDDLEKLNTSHKMDNGTFEQTEQARGLPEFSMGSNSNSINHQDLPESSIQNQQNEKREHFKDYNGESEYHPSQNNLPDNATSVQSNHSLRSPENRRDEEVVSEVEFPLSSAESEASGEVSEIETEQVPNISTSGSSPKSVLQPKFSSDHVSLMDHPSQGTSTEYHQNNNQIVDDDSVLPLVNLNHSAFQNASHGQDDSTSQLPHGLETLQSPRFADALSCVPFRSRLKEHQNHDASITTSTSRSHQDMHDPYPRQSNFNQESDTCNHTDDSFVNDSQARTNLESVENIKGDNHNESSMKQETATVFMDPSNSSTSKSIEDTKEVTREIDGQEGAFGTSKSTQGNTESAPHVKLEDFQEAMLNDVANQPKEAKARDSSVTSKTLDAVFDQKQAELNNSTDNFVAHVDIKEQLDPPLESTMKEGNNSAANQNNSVITKSDDSEFKSMKGDTGEASEHVIRAEDVLNPSELDATLDSKYTADVEGGLTNHSEVEITADDHK